MKIIKTVSEWRKYRKNHAGISFGFVPTMGALHDGHLSLVKKSTAENDQTIVSIYLNPTQFDNPDDLNGYPATWDTDRLKLEKHNVDILFAPDYKQIYPDDYRYKLIESELSNRLCGAVRSGHFDGVLTIVLKFFNIIGECRAYFGEKDYQQYLLIKGMAEAFYLPVSVIACPLIREDDGLAMSSRNVKLSEAGRKKAPLFYKHLSNGSSLNNIKAALKADGFIIDYVEKYEGRLFAAVILEKVRLIDNVKY